jgi:hypothetical protein
MICTKGVVLSLFKYIILFFIFIIIILINLTLKVSLYYHFMILKRNYFIESSCLQLNHAYYYYH